MTSTGPGDGDRPGAVPPAPDSIARNQAYWTGQAPHFAEPGRLAWATDGWVWGIFGVDEDEVGALTGIPLEGADVVELGCGTGYISAWLARRGARPIGVDPTAAQLANAARFQIEFDLRFPLVRAAGEDVPLRGGAFDLVISEYGAALWADPYRWVPEAARLLRPGGHLVLLTNSVLQILCAPDAEAPVGTTLQRPLAGLHAVEFTDDPGVEFHLAHGQWLRLLTRCGFVDVELFELYAPPDAEDTTYVTAAWARRWPHEEIWRARRAPTG